MPRRKLDRPNYQLGRRGARYVVNWTDPDTGKSRSISTGQTERGSAEIWRDQWIAGREQAPPPGQPTIGAILEGYVAARRLHVESVETLTLAAKTVRRHVGNLEPRMLARRTFLDRRAREGVADGSIRREVTVLRAALAWAMREKWIDTAPYAEMPPRPPPRDRWLTREEIGHLIQACGMPHVRLFVMLAYHTAARRGAILELTWDRVDLDRRRIHYQRPGRRLTKKRRAVVPINTPLLVALQAAKIHAVGEHVVEYHGRPVQSVRTGFDEACRRAGIEDCSPHVLRHTAATHMVMSGVPIAEIARMLGDTIEMVERVYGKHSPDYLRRAADALAGDILPRIVSPTVSEK